MLRTKFVTVFIFLCFTPICVSAGAHSTEDCKAQLTELEALIKFEPRGADYVYGGLTKRGAEVLAGQHDVVIKSEQIMGSRLFEMESYTNTTRIVQVGSWNEMVLGPGGGAKTAFFRMLIPGLWIKQVHAMMNEVPLVGGVTEEDNKRGQDGLNIRRTILDNVRFAMIDEGEKLNPAVQSVLLSLLNTEERYVTVGGVPIEAKELRSIIYTGNATLPELLDYFSEQGQGTTGPPFLRRFLAKFRIPNWLSQEAQQKIDDMKERRDFLKVVGLSHPEVLKDMVFQNPSHLDYDAIQQFANAAFVLTPEAKVVARTLMHELKDETHRATRDSEAKHRDDKASEPYILTPSVDFSEALRGEIPRWVRVSAALDFLRSPMATRENIEKFTAHKIKLGPLSLWRTWNMLTTVTPNRTLFDPVTKTIQFNAQVINGRVTPVSVEEAISKAKDSREILELTHDRQAQERFTTALTNRWKLLKNSLEEVARVMESDLNDVDFEEVDFEVALAKLGGTDVMRFPEPMDPQRAH